MLENGYASFQHFKKDETGADRKRETTNTKQQKVYNSNQLTF